MVEEKNNKDKKEMEEKVEEAIKKMKESGESFRKNLKDQQGTVIKAISAGMAVLPKDARKHILTAHKESIEAGKVMVEDYLDALNNLMKEVSN